MLFDAVPEFSGGTFGRDAKQECCFRDIVAGFGVESSLIIDFRDSLRIGTGDGRCWTGSGFGWGNLSGDDRCLIFHRSIGRYVEV